MEKDETGRGSLRRWKNQQELGLGEKRGGTERKRVGKGKWRKTDAVMGNFGSFAVSPASQETFQNSACLVLRKKSCWYFYSYHITLHI